MPSASTTSSGTRSRVASCRPSGWWCRTARAHWSELRLEEVGQNVESPAPPRSPRHGRPPVDQPRAEPAHLIGCHAQRIAAAHDNDSLRSRAETPRPNRCVRSACLVRSRVGRAAGCARGSRRPSSCRTGCPKGVSTDSARVRPGAYLLDGCLPAHKEAKSRSPDRRAGRGVVVADARVQRMYGVLVRRRLLGFTRTVNASARQQTMQRANSQRRLGTPYAVKTGPAIRWPCRCVRSRAWVRSMPYSGS